MMGQFLSRLLGWVGARPKEEAVSVERDGTNVSATAGRTEAPAALGTATTNPPVEATKLPAAVRIHSGVLRTMFDDFHEHKATDRGQEETGWLLLGRRSGTDGVIVEAVLPPGEYRDAGTAHVNMNSTAQAVAMRILKKSHPELDVLGVAHTHPGRLNRPSHGDFQGDSLWVSKLRKREGLFAIGVWDFHELMNSPREPANAGGGATADIRGGCSTSQTRGRASFYWFALAEGEGWYRHLPVEETPGDDFGREVRAHWEVIEHFAGSIDRLIRMQPALQPGLIPVEVMETPTMVLCQPLAREGEELQVVLQGREVGFFRMSAGITEEIVGPSERLDAAFFEVMARLARGLRREAKTCS